MTLVFIGFLWHLLFIERGIMSPNKGQILLPLLWAGLRFGVRAVTALTFLLALTMAFFTIQFHQGLTAGTDCLGGIYFRSAILIGDGLLAGSYSGNHPPRT